MAQVVLRDLWDNRRGRLKDEPTVGEEERPAEPPAPDAARAVAARPAG